MKEYDRKNYWGASQLTVSGKCLYCGKTVEVPEDISEFSCLYCGQRQKLKDMLAAQNRNEDRAAEELAWLEKNLIQAAIRYPDYYRRITKKLFPPAFERYEDENREIMIRLDRYVSFSAREDAVDQVCELLLNEMEGHMQKDKRWQRKPKHPDVLFEYKVLLALYLTPLVRKLELACAEQFRDRLHALWIARYPNQEWIPGDYELLMNGFKRGKLCYITTATCAFDGKPDDCPELTELRRFRDGWLQQSPDGDALIARYYELAPSIVTCIDHCDDSGERYAEIRERWLEPCLAALSGGNYEDCRVRYVDMVQTLQRRYRQS